MRRRTAGFVVAGLVVALVLAFGVSRFASSQPDGLEKVAADQSLDSGESPHAMADSPFADYSTDGVDDRGLSTGIAGVVGVLATFAVAGGLVWVAVRIGHRRAGGRVDVSGGHAHAHDLDGGPVESAVQRLDASVKLVSLLGFVSAVVATPPQAMAAFAGYAALVAVAVAAARLPVRVLVRRMAIEIPFVAFALALPFVGTGERTDVAGVSLSIAGLWGAWAILAKASLGVAATVVLSWSTPVADVLAGLDRLRVPRVMVVIAGFMVRYLHVLSGELHRLQVARVSRGDDPRWFWQGRAVAATAGTLFVRSYERGERVQQAMLARGFTGHFPTTSVPGPRSWVPALLWPAAAWAVAVGAWLR